MSSRLLQRLEMHAKERPDALALRQAWPKSGASWTWSQLRQRVEGFCDHLINALPAGSIVMLCSGNCPEYVAAYLAILKTKMSVFPVAPDLAEPEMLDAATRSGAAAMIAIGQREVAFKGHFQQHVAFQNRHRDVELWFQPCWHIRENAGVCMLLLSSGTTATPKIVRRDAASLDAVAEQMVHAVQFAPDDRVLAAVPLCHSYGVEHGLLAPVWAGSGVFLCDGFDRGVAIDLLDSGEVSILPGVPFMYEMLAEAQIDRAKLNVRLAYSAGAPLPPALFDTFQYRFGVRVTQLYGATEIGSVTFNSPDDEPFDLISVGRSMQSVHISILDPSAPDIANPLPAGEEGHVAVKAASMMSGYLDGEAAPLLDGYFLTGDLGRLDARGRLSITGRIKLLIDIGGRKVNPLEVERVIESHPSVGACIVVPMRVSQTLLRLKAIVTPARKDVSIDPRELRELARQQLSAYKVPRIIEVRDALPRSPAGKVLRHLVQR
jgi:long-chain acyl-CoA synthetase